MDPTSKMSARPRVRGGLLATVRVDPVDLEPGRGGRERDDARLSHALEIACAGTDHTRQSGLEIRQTFAEMFRSNPAQRERISTFGYRTGNSSRESSGAAPAARPPPARGGTSTCDGSRRVRAAGAAWIVRVRVAGLPRGSSANGSRRGRRADRPRTGAASSSKDAEDRATSSARPFGTRTWSSRRPRRAPADSRLRGMLECSPKDFDRMVRTTSVMHPSTRRAAPARGSRGTCRGRGRRAPRFQRISRPRGSAPTGARRARAGPARPSAGTSGRSRTSRRRGRRNTCEWTARRPRPDKDGARVLRRREPSVKPVRTRLRAGSEPTQCDARRVGRTEKSRRLFDADRARPVGLVEELLEERRRVGQRRSKGREDRASDVHLDRALHGGWHLGLGFW